MATLSKAPSLWSSYFLRSERAGFRAWRPDDLPLARLLWGDPAVTRLIVAAGKLDDPAIEARLRMEIATREAYGVQYWPVFLVTTGDFIGCCGLHPYRPEDGVFELGVHLRPAYWGGGLATEMAHAVIGHAFGRLNLTGLFAGHNPDNQRSRRVLAKLGFRYTHDEFYPPTGLKHPSYFLAR